MSYSIRNADERDLDALVKLENECFSVPWTRGQLRCELPDERHEFLVAQGENGEILGYDAKGWLVNHHKRQYRRDIISLSSAAERVSPKLTVESSQKALIPADDLSEKLCYEFRCKADNGRTALVYINAETGREEQILLLVESEFGVLTV